MSATHFDKALEATRKGFVAAREIALRLESLGLAAKVHDIPDRNNHLYKVQALLLDLRLQVADVEAHLRLSDAAEEHSLRQIKEKESLRS